MPGDAADLLLCNGAVFDGWRFPPAGTRVHVWAGKIVEGRPEFARRAR